MIDPDKFNPELSRWLKSRLIEAAIMGLVLGFVSGFLLFAKL